MEESFLFVSPPASDDGSKTQATPTAYGVSAPVKTAQAPSLHANGDGNGSTSSTFLYSDEPPKTITTSKIAQMKGYSGDACQECGQFTMVRNGACLKCNACGSTSGCS